MIRLLWTSEIYGSAEHIDAESILAAPRFGDGDWQGGWWGRYRRDSGELVWQKYHRRGACLFGVVDNVIVASTHKYSGVYAISFHNGEKLWTRLGDRFAWLLKLIEHLPCDNEGDGPERIWRDQILTRGGRLLDRNTGRILSRHAITDQRDANCHLISSSVDGEPLPIFHTPKYRDGGIPLQPQRVEFLDRTLIPDGMELSQFLPAGGLTFMMAWEQPPQGHISRTERFTEKPRDLPTWFFVLDTATRKILFQDQFGSCYTAEVVWVDRATLAITLQTKAQWGAFRLSNSYRRYLRIYALSPAPAL